MKHSLGKNWDNNYSSKRESRISHFAQRKGIINFFRYIPMNKTKMHGKEAEIPREFARQSNRGVFASAGRRTRS